ncbi:MAG: hypothetical protein BWY31_03726 [Lentisphaerae bacterium ADurb.Bin242]|nr:MAG: hypothetical protein BWY31_03726 [Lentisphaerae bacterium ADurb.Bin242]
MKFSVCAIGFVFCFMLFSQSREKEADAFYREYMKQLKTIQCSQNTVPPEWDSAGQKIASAAVLVPQNMVYRHDAMFHRVCGIYKENNTWQDRFSLYEQFFRDVAVFKKDFPKIENPRFRSVFYNPDIPVMPFEPFSLIQKDATSAERRQLAGIFSRFRAVMAEEIREKYKDIDFRKTLEKQFDLVRLASWCTENLRGVTDNLTMVRESYNLELEFMRCFQAALRRNPGLKEQYVYQPRYRFPGLVSDYDLFLAAETLEEIAKICSSLKEYEDLANRIGRPFFKLRAAELHAIGQFLNSKNRTGQEYQDALEKLFRQVESLTGRPVTSGNYYEYAARMEAVVRLHAARSGISIDGDTVQRAVLSYRGKKTETPLMPEQFLVPIHLESARDGSAVFRKMDEIAKNAKIIRQWKSHDLLTGNPVDLAYGMVADALYNMHNPKAFDTVRTLFPDFEIREIHFPDDGYRPDNLYGGVHVCVLDKNFYFLLGNSSPRLTVFSAKTGTFSELPPLKADLTRPKFFASAGYLIVASGGDVHLFDLADKTWTTIRDLSDVEATGCLISGNRLYRLAGHLVPVSLVSCDLKGGKRNVHFASSRSQELPELAGVRTAQTSQLVEAQPGKLLFTMDVPVQMNRGGLFLFDTDTGKLSRVSSMRTSMPFLWKNPDGRIFGNYDYIRIFVIDRNSFRPNPFLSFVTHSGMSGLSGSYRLNLRPVPLFPALVTKDDTLIAPATRLYVNLKAPASTLPLWLPYGSAVMELDDRSFAISNHCGIILFNRKK